MVVALGACFAPVPAPGAPCGPGGVCPTGLRCIGGACLASSSECEDRADGEPCGDPASSTCDAPDTCLAGACALNYAPNNLACGATAGDDCGTRDLCDGAGACAPTSVEPGTVCYSCASGPGACAACDTTQTCLPAADCGATLVDGELLSPNTTTAIAEPGNMFDVVAIEPVTITGFEQNFSTAGETVFEIYYKAGTHVGFEMDATAWTSAGQATITTQSSTMSAIPIPIDIALAAGERYAFYLTNTGIIRNRYSTGTAVGEVAFATPELSLRQGTANRYPFTDKFEPRIWQGKIKFRHTDSGRLATMAADGTQSAGVMFDVLASAPVRATELAIELEPGDHVLDVYFRRGSHVGAEAEPAAWRALAQGLPVTSSGVGTPTAIPHAFDVQLEPNESAAFYITNNSGLTRVRSQMGTAVGTSAGQTSELTVHEGTAIADQFGAIGVVVAPSVEITYRICP